MSKTNTEGINHPSIDKLLSQIDSKYKLAYAAAKIAHIINEEKMELDDVTSITPVGQALEEIINGKLKIEFHESYKDIK